MKPWIRSRAAMRVTVAMFTIAAVLGGCAGASVQSSPSPTAAPASVVVSLPSASSASPTAAPSAAVSPSTAPSLAAKPACLDAASYSIIQDIVTATDSGVAVASLTKNSDLLISALEGFQPPAAFDAKWRDELVAALKAKDYQTALQKILLIQTQEVVLTSC